MRRGDYRQISWSEEINTSNSVFSYPRNLVHDILFPYPTPPKSEMNPFKFRISKSSYRGNGVSSYQKLVAGR